MKQVAVLTIDVGLTNLKAALFAADGRLLVAASTRYPTANPRPGWSEQDPSDWWVALVSAAREALGQPQAQTVNVGAISITGHMHALTLTDRQGRPLSNCLTLFDNRAEPEARGLRESLGPAIYRTTGGRLEAYTPAAKIAWLHRHAPEQLRGAGLLLAPKDVIRCQLGGEPVTDPIDAAGTVLFDLQKRCWADDLAAAVGATTDQLPEVREPWQGAGTLDRAAASALGLRAGTPLVVGAGDDIETIGAGVVAPGQVLEHIGTTGTLIACSSQPLFDPREAVEVYPHPLADRYLVGGATNAAGRSLDWARRFVPGLPTGDPLPLAYPPAAGAAHAPLYLPFILGERGLLWDSRATGAFLGLREAHAPQDLANSVYYGVAFSLCEILEGIRGLGGAPEEIIAGAGLEQAGWAQLRADTYGLPLSSVDHPYPTGLGAALLGLMNLGEFTTLDAAVAACCRTGPAILPDANRTAAVRRRFAAYLAAVDACRVLFPTVAALVEA